MNRSLRSRFARRDLGHQRVRTVTTWTAAGGAVLAVATGVALAGADAASTPTSQDTTTGGTSYTQQGGTGSQQPRSRRGDDGSQQLQAPALPPAPAFGFGNHASSGGS